MSGCDDFLNVTRAIHVMFLVKKNEQAPNAKQNLQRKRTTSKDLVAGLYMNEISKDLSQTDQFRE